MVCIYFNYNIDNIIFSYIVFLKLLITILVSFLLYLNVKIHKYLKIHTFINKKFKYLIYKYYKYTIFIVSYCIFIVLFLVLNFNIIGRQFA